MDTLIKSQNKKIYGPYDHHLIQNLHCHSDEDKTKQSFGDECNINTIMAKYAKTGIIESGNSMPPSYGETRAFDFQEAQNLIISAENHFNALPALIRSKFDNDPHSMLAWMDNPQNAAEAASLGLLQAAVDVQPAQASLNLLGAPHAPLIPAMPA